MMLRRRLIPVAALVVAIGASAAGAATAAETGGSGGNSSGTAKPQKATCRVELKGDTFKKGNWSDTAAAAETKALAAGKGRIVQKGNQPSADECRKKVAVISLDTVATKLGVSKAALVQALTETKQWIATSGAKPSVAQFEQHLADLLHVPVSKVASVFTVKHGA